MNVRRRMYIGDVKLIHNSINLHNKLIRPGCRIHTNFIQSWERRRMLFFYEFVHELQLARRRGTGPLRGKSRGLVGLSLPSHYRKYSKTHIGMEIGQHVLRISKNSTLNTQLYFKLEDLYNERFCTSESNNVASSEAEVSIRRPERVV